MTHGAVCKNAEGQSPLPGNFPQLVLKQLGVAELEMGNISSDTNFCPGNLGQCGAWMDGELGERARWLQQTAPVHLWF